MYKNKSTDPHTYTQMASSAVSAETKADDVTAARPLPHRLVMVTMVCDVCCTTMDEEGDAAGVLLQLVDNGTHQLGYIACNAEHAKVAAAWCRAFEQEMAPFESAWAMLEGLEDANGSLVCTRSSGRRQEGCSVPKQALGTARGVRYAAKGDDTAVDVYLTWVDGAHTLGKWVSLVDLLAANPSVRRSAASTTK